MTDFTVDPNAGTTLVSNNTLVSNIAQQQSNVGSLGTEDFSQTSFNSTSPTTVPIASADASSVDPSAVSANSTINTININSVGRNNSIQVNPFDDYIDVTYGISLAMLSRSAIDTIAQNPVSSTPQSSSDIDGVGPDDYIVFASTGESKTSATRDSLNGSTTPEYYNIQGYTFKSFLGHLPQNPMTAVIFDAKMELFEPYGFSFREDIEAMRSKLGYDDKLEPLNYVYRVEIWFSGWKPTTGEWVRNIQFPLNDQTMLNSVVYYVVITTVEASITPQGTMYAFSMQAMPHKTMRPDALIYRMEGVPVLGGSGGASTVTFGSGTPSPTFGTFIQNLTDRLQKQVKTDTTAGNFEGLKVVYHVYAPDWLLNQNFDGEGQIQVAHGSVDYNAASGTYVYAAQDVDILTFLYNVMDHIPIVRSLMLREDDSAFLFPSVTWNIRSNLHYTGSPNDLINGFDGYTYDYYIEPVLSYRSRTTVPEKRNDRVDNGNQQSRVQNMLSYGMILRAYDFYFSNDNSEVINLDFKYRTFYQEPFPAQVGSLRGESQQDNNPNWQSEDQQRLQRNAAQASAPTVDFAVPPTSQTLTQILGQAVNPQSATSTSDTAAKKHQGMLRQQSPQQGTQAERGSKQPNMNLYQYAKQQYFRYDMIDGNMTVRFDPTWLLNPYMAGGDFTPRLPEDASSISQVAFYTHLDRVVLLRSSAPTQTDFMNPFRTRGSSENQDAMSGFYQVIEVVSEFRGGQFIQKLNMFKYPHLNGYSTMATNSTPSIQNPSSSGTLPTTISGEQTQVKAPDPTTSNPLG